MSGGTSRTASPWKRLGGKAKLHKWIIAHLGDHESYNEVFGGSAAVLLAKPRPKGQEVYNDLDGLWTNSLAIARDQGAELARLIALTPYSRAEFDRARSTLKEWREGTLAIEPLELARLHLVVLRQSFSADGGSWSTTQFGGESRPRLWARLPRIIERMATRLQGVYLEQKDYTYILERYDHPRAAFYIDPPYLGVEGLYYDVNRHGGFDHQALRELVDKCQGTVVISYYAHPEIEALYGGWDISRRQVTVHSGDTKRTETELLIVRYSDFAKCRSRRPQIQEFFDDDGNDLLGGPDVTANNLASISESGLLDPPERHKDARASAAAGMCIDECGA